MSNVNAWNSPHHNSLPNISALESLEETTSERCKKTRRWKSFC